MNTLAFSNCELEPIRFPGAVQPHGALLVLQADSGVIDAASESCQALLGLPAASLLGQSFAAIFGPAAQADVLAADGDGLPPLTALSRQGKALAAKARHNQEAGQVLVDIERDEQDAATFHRLIYQCRRDLGVLRNLGQIPLIANETVERIRAMTGFDRVMVYRFDEAWNGEVIAEARIDAIEPYLGLNFPASDIPRQVRDLFLSAKVRMIPDALHTPSALLARHDSCTIDLAQSSLRSVSPYHIEYMKNMAVRATLAGALIVDGRLWGLVSCQQKNEPKYFGPSARDVFGGFCADLAALLEATLIRQQRERERGLAVRRRRLAEVIRAFDFKTLIQHGETADLLGVVGADGFALLVDDALQTTGNTPAFDRIRDLQKRRRECASDPALFASNTLARDLGVADAGDGIAGALFVSIRNHPKITMVWFRNERRYSVNWGGDPSHAHHVSEKGELSPRKSFALFLQAVRGEAPAWSPEELDSAAELGSLIEIELLREEQAFTQSVLNSSPEHIVVLDANGVIESVNNAWKRYAENNGAPDLACHSVGLSYKNICLAASDKPGEIEAASAWVGIEAVLKRTLDHFTLDYPCDSQGERHWFRMHVYPMLAPRQGAVIAHENITERKHSEDLLRESESRFRMLADSTPALIWISGLDKQCQYVNKVWLAFTGRRYEQELGNGWVENIHPDDRSQCLAVFAMAFKARQAFVKEFRLRRDDGEYRWLVNNGVPRLGGEGEFLGFIGSCIDITERKRMADELTGQRNRLDNIIKGTHVGTWEWNIQTGATVFNARWAEMIGYTLDELAPVSIKTWMSLVHPDDRQRSEERLAAHFSGELPYYECEARMRHQDGHWVWVLDRGQVTARTPDGKPLLMYGTHQDISSRKANEALLVVAREQAEMANVAKSRFLATISHEIRTPMNAILGMAQMLLQPKLKDSQRLDYAKAVLDSGQTLLTLLNDILDFSKVEAGKLELESAALEPAQIIHKTWSLFAESARHKGLSLESNWAGPTGQSYEGDPYRLRQMLSNLVGNAIKFTAQGQVLIEGREVERAGETALLEFAVIDTGIGLTTEQQQRLFQPFAQADNSITRQYGGTGLGLSIVRSLASLMGGDSGVESEAGHGARFWFRVRAGLVATGDASRVAEPSLVEDAWALPKTTRLTGRVMVVEDIQSSRKVAEAMLNKLGLTVVLVENGQQSVDILMRGVEVDAILLDLNMPVMNGYATAERIRRWEAEQGRPRCPIIALTADVREENRQRCLASDIDEFVSKPLPMSALAAALSRWLPAATPPDAPAPDKPAKAIDTRLVAELLREIEPLLEQRRFDAVARFKELQETLADTELADEIAEIGPLLADFSFETALEHLRRLDVTQARKGKP
jgi:PAS domain S-box-containing protein